MEWDGMALVDLVVLGWAGFSLAGLGCPWLCWTVLDWTVLE